MAEPFIAEIVLFGGNFAPRNWSFCNGSLLPIASNTALFSLVGTIYGGNGSTTFGLPDLRGRTAVHQGNGPGLQPVSLGETGGSESITLTQNNLPSHTHVASSSVAVNDATGDQRSPGGHFLARDSSNDRLYSNGIPAASLNAGAVSVNVGSTGSGAALSNRTPYLGIHYIIALQGIFPSRN